MEVIAEAENFVQVDFFQYNIEIIDVSLIGELATRRVGIYFNTVRQVRYNGHICYVTNANALFKAYLCPSCDQFVKKANDRE